MAVASTTGQRVTAADLIARKRAGRRIPVLTAYDATMAHLLETAGIDVLLVGDSLGPVVLGYETTVPVTVGAIVHHTRAVTRGTRRALVIADMPFLSCHVTPARAVRDAGRLIQQGGAAAVKIEGGRPVLHVVRRLVDAGIPVMGHLGLLPQSVHLTGGYRRQATTPDGADQLLADAVALEEAGAFSVVLECIPSPLARAVTERLTIPAIGIGTECGCDGQVLVTPDMLGLFEDPPPFVKPYARLAELVVGAARAYIEDTCRQT